MVDVSNYPTHKQTYEPIATQTLGSGIGIITFSSIPGTYKDLFLMVVYGAASSAGPTLRLRINSDTGSNYSWTYLQGSGTTVGSSRLTSQTSGGIGLSNQGASTSLDNIAFAHFMSYANTNIYKTFLGGGDCASREVDNTVNLWRSTSAITSISVSPGVSFPSQNFASGTTASLYGIAG